MEKSYTISYKEYTSIEELPEADRHLMQQAIQTTSSAYSPYSHFQVGAALRLADGSIITGSNQENVAYPSGLCAERTAIFSASAHRPDMRHYEALAIVGKNASGQLCEASPCGACRQVLSEYENNQHSPIRVLCMLDGGRIREIESISDLLPFSFTF